jgi:quercetin dioxygenase-like cupin family protein
MPGETLADLVVPHAIPADERIWVPQGENVWFRPLCLSRSQGCWMNLLRVRKAGVLSRHRHPQPVHGLVLKGRWRYLEHDWVAEEGANVFEPPGETHTLVVPDGVEEMITEPAEVAAGVVFLASPLASYVTGAVMVIDGGYLVT